MLETRLVEILDLINRREFKIDMFSEKELQFLEGEGYVILREIEGKQIKGGKLAQTLISQKSIKRYTITQKGKTFLNNCKK